MLEGDLPGRIHGPLGTRPEHENYLQPSFRGSVDGGVKVGPLERAGLRFDAIPVELHSDARHAGRRKPIQEVGSRVSGHARQVDIRAEEGGRGGEKRSAPKESGGTARGHE